MEHVTSAMKSMGIQPATGTRRGNKGLQYALVVLLFLAVLWLPLSRSRAEKIAVPYDRVIIFALDASGTFIKDANTPNFDRIFSEGCITYEARATVPTKSAPGWGAMFYGVPGEVHGIDNLTAENSHKTNDLYPSIFKLTKEAYPKAKIAVFSNWHAVPWGLIEWDCGVDVFPTKKTVPTMSEVYKQLFKYLGKGKPKLLLIYNGDVDTALHDFGYGSREYLEAMEKADAEMGMVYDELERKGLLENALVLFATDHGGKDKGHGGGTENEIRCTFAVAGPGIENHGVIEDMELQDVAAIVLYALGIEQPEIMTARVPRGIFPGVGGAERKQSRIHETLRQYGNHESGADSPALGFSESLMNKLVYFEDFEGSSIKGLNGVQQFSEGYFGKGLNLKESYLETGVKAGAKWPGLTVGFWFRDTGKNAGDPVFMADKNWLSGKNKGFTIAKPGDRIKINVGGGKKYRGDIVWTLPDGYKDQWVHCLVIFDQASRKVSLYCDFEYVGSAELLPKTHSGWASGKKIVFGQDITGKYRYQMDADVDEIMVFNQVLTEEEIGELRARYEP